MMGITVLMIIGILAPVIAAPRMAGIGVRGSYWKRDGIQTEYTVIHNLHETRLNMGSGGGWIYFFSRINENLFAEFSLGAVGEVESRTNFFQEEDTRVSAVTPILFGLRLNLLPLESRSALQPYLTGGVGPYWFHDVHVQESSWGYEEEVTSSTRLKRGAYAGGGTNFWFTDWFGLNFDVRYHFINFENDHPESGFEYGLGAVFAWGNYYRD